MRLIKSLLFIVLLATLVFLLYFVTNSEEEAVQVSLQDQLTLAEHSDSLLRKELLDTLQISRTSPMSALFEDFEARLENGNIVISKGNRLVGQYSLNQLTLRQVLLADLNGDDVPECWLLGIKSSKQVEIFALEIKSGHIKRINFPTLKGSQAFGYVGADSLYFDKSTIARQFKFTNDPYADVESGRRVCFYQFGKDHSFVLKKTIDLE